MFLVAGLGNPGEEYALTPHNLGFLTVDRLAERHGIRVTRKDSKALIGVGEIDGREVMLAKPQTFMNLSGTSLAPLMEKHSIGTERLIVVYDELDLPWRSLRIKPNGSAAGHNGMKSVIGSLKTSEIARVRRLPLPYCADSVLRCAVGNLGPHVDKELHDASLTG